MSKGDSMIGEGVVELTFMDILPHLHTIQNECQSTCLKEIEVKLKIKELISTTIIYDPSLPNEVKLRCPRGDEMVNKILVEITSSMGSEAIGNAIQSMQKLRANGAPTMLSVSRGSQEWKNIAMLCGNDLEVVRIDKISNRFLEAPYENFKETLREKSKLFTSTQESQLPGDDSVNERWLFHGSLRTDPTSICLSLEGFDPRLARQGNYGRGTYFSTTPNYPAKLYPFRRNSNDNTSGQIILARVACGRQYNMNQYANPKLVRPPPVSRENPYLLFDSVFGGPFTKLSTEMEMAVIYEKTQALPNYVITFRYKESFYEVHNALEKAIHQTPPAIPQTPPATTAFGPSSPSMHPSKEGDTIRKTEQQLGASEVTSCNKGKRPWSPSGESSSGCFDASCSCFDASDKRKRTCLANVP